MDRNALVNALMAKMESVKGAVSDDLNMLTNSPKEWAAQRVAKYLPTDSESSEFRAAMLQGGDWYETPYAQKLMGLALMGGSGKGGSGKKVQTVSIPATKEFFESVGIPEKRVFADIDKLYRKHPDLFKDATEVQNHLTQVFSGKPTYTLPAGDPNFNLIVRKATDFPPDSAFAYRAAAADFRPNEKQQYWVKTALPMPESQLQWKLIKEAEGRLETPVVKLKRPQDEK